MPWETVSSSIRCSAATSPPTLRRTRTTPTTRRPFYRCALAGPGQRGAARAELSRRRPPRPTGIAPSVSAKELVAKDANNRIAHLVLGLNSFKSGDYAKADKEFEAASDGPVGELTSALARAWNALAAGSSEQAKKYLDTAQAGGVGANLSQLPSSADLRHCRQEAGGDRRLRAQLQAGKPDPQNIRSRTRGTRQASVTSSWRGRSLTAKPTSRRTSRTCWCELRDQIHSGKRSPF